MTRTGADEYINGTLRNGYSYIAQVWVKDGIVQPCAHPANMRTAYSHCCAADRYKGQSIMGVEAVLIAAAAAE